MEYSSQAPSQSPPKRYWNGSKIIALILTVVAATFAAEAGVYYSTHQSSPLTCGNGATNYSTCNLCISGQTLASGRCVNNCGNSAINPPTCTRLSVVIGASPDPAITGQLVTFSATTTGGEGKPTCYWNFGDLTEDTGCSMTHIFSYAGTFTVSVRVTESAGAMNDSATNTTSEIVNQRTCSNSPFNPPAMNYSAEISIQILTIYSNGSSVVRSIPPSGAGEPGLPWYSHTYDSYGIRCNYPLYMDPAQNATYPGFSKINVVSSMYHNYTLGDFFAVWGMTLGQNDTISIPASDRSQWSMCVGTSQNIERPGLWDQEPLISGGQIILYYGVIGCL